jgi:hypothetical protein
MIISNSHNFIFVHIHKAAGTSIARKLDESLQWNDLVLGGTVLGEKMQEAYHDRFGLHKHSRAKEIKAIVGKALWESYFTFAFVRNPYDRTVSLYTYIEKLIKTASVRRYIPSKRVRKEPFWNYPATKAYLETNSFSAFIRNPHLVEHAVGMQPQTGWILDEHGEMMVDFIGKVETINEDFKAVCDKIKIKYSPLGVHNRSRNHKKNRFPGTERDRSYLYERYKSDFEALGYDPHQTFSAEES